MGKVDVLYIIATYLKDNGFDGLWNAEIPCGCEISDLCPCGEIDTSCMPGYKKPCVCGEGCDWDIGTRDEEADAELSSDK